VPVRLEHSKNELALLELERVRAAERIEELTRQIKEIQALQSREQL
jgi:hypothetical protein